MRYLLNSAVLTMFGEYEYVPMTVLGAREWYFDSSERPLSTIGYEETAAALSLLLDGEPISVNKQIIEMQVGDEALVFRLKFPPGTGRIQAKDKGRLGALLRDPNNIEIGLLRRKS